MRYLIPLLIVPSLALSGCNSGPSVSASNASMAEVAAKTKDALKIEPGQWANTTEVLAFDMPGMTDPAMKEMFAKGLKESKSTAFSHCVTPEEAEKPSAAMFAAKDNGECRYDSFTMSGGRIDAKMTCKPKSGGGSMTMTMAGTYTATAYDMTVDMIMPDAAGPHGGMTMKAKTTGKRTGVCTAQSGAPTT